MSTRYDTLEDSKQRRLLNRLDRMTSDQEFIAVQSEILNNHKSEAQKRIEEAKRKCAERREKKMLQTQN